MGFRFFRRIKIFPGMYINLGKRGASVSLGPRGAKMTIGRTGIKSSVGVPGTGFRYEQKIVDFGKTTGSGKSAPRQSHSFISHASPTNTMPNIPNSGQVKSMGLNNIDDILITCREARVWNAILNVSFTILIGAIMFTCCAYLGNTVPLTALIGFGVALIISLLFRVAMHLEIKVQLTGMYVPGQGDSLAQIMRVVFKSEDVRYSPHGLFRTGRASVTTQLPFPLSVTPGIVSFRFGNIEIVPLTNYVLIFNGMSVDAVPDGKIGMNVGLSRRTVSASQHIPSDAYITHQKWLHTTVKGLPDRRYSYNPGEVTYQLGTISIFARDVFSIAVSFSGSAALSHISKMMAERGGGNMVHMQTSGVAMRGHNTFTGDPSSLIATASKNLTDFIRTLSRDKQGLEIMESVGGVKDLDKFARHCRFNPRFAMLLYGDACKVFRDLGYSTKDLTGLEGLGFLLLVAHLFNFEIKSDELLNPGYAAKVAPIISRFVDDMKFSASAEGKDDLLLLHLALNQSSGNHEWAVKYATLMYRWASVIAKADGTITSKESKCLSELMKLKDETSGCNVRVSGNDSDGSGQFNGNNHAQVNYDSPRPKAGLNGVMKNLDSLIGLTSVKNEVRQLASFIEIQLKRKARGLKVAPITYHCVFTGNPGTGKTTIARILGGIYREMGVVKKGQLVETDRSGLVAEYVGQTAVKTNKIIDSALDGVLFIDEAYSLVQGGEKDYGREAISTLLKRMEDDRDRLVVILAGYTDEMKEFIDSNPGLQSRFNRYIEFPDYSAEELAKIFLMYAEKNQYTCNKDVQTSIVNVMEVAVQNKDRNFGNARYVRNLFEKAIQRQAVRLSTVVPITTEMLTELTLHDLGFAYED